MHRITTDLNRHFFESLGVTSDSSALLVIPFNRTSQIWSMKAKGDARTAVQLTNGTSDGRAGIAELADNRIVYISRTGDHVDLWQMNADGTGQKQLTTDPPSLEEVHAAPDGRYLIFASNRNGREHLFRVDADGANLKQLTSGDSKESDSDCSPDGQWIVYASKPVLSDGNEDETLWRVSIDGGTPIHLTLTPASSPHFSPDGKFVSYVYVEKVNWKIAVVAASGGEPIKKLDPVKAPELNIGSRFTPDGQALTYIVTRKNTSNIWLQPLNGDAPRPLTDFKDGEIYNYAFSRDGTRLLLARGHQIHDALLIKNFK
jgi:Tol biopolymer transport system component